MRGCGVRFGFAVLRWLRWVECDGAGGEEAADYGDIACGVLCLGPDEGDWVLA